MNALLQALLSKPHLLSAGIRGAIGAVAGALLLGGLRAVLDSLGYSEPFYIRFAGTSYERLFAATWRASFPDVAVLLGGIAAVLVVLLIAQIWKIVAELP